MYGKVVHKQKPTSKKKTRVIIKLDDGQIKEYDFSTEIDNWTAAADDKSTNKKNAIFATVLTKAQVAEKRCVQEAVAQKLKKFEDFSAFEIVEDRGQAAIKTRWVFT